MELDAAKLMKPCIELNLGVWQGDCLLGIDQNRSKMFRRPRMQMLVLWQADSHCPDDSAEIPHPAIGELSRLGRGRVEFERCCLTRRRGGAEKHAENIFFGLASVLARLRRKVNTCERGDSGDHTASQRGSRWGGRLTNAARGGYRNAVCFNEKGFLSFAAEKVFSASVFSVPRLDSPVR